MRLVLVLLFLAASIVAPGSSPVSRAQEMAFETYTGLGWTITWDPKLVQLDSVSDLKYTNIREGCNLALDYPQFTLCARNFDGATYEFSAPSRYDLQIPADNIQQMRDTFYPDAEPVSDDLTSRPGFASDEIAWQLFADSAESNDDDAILESDAVYIEVRWLSPDERVMLVVTGLTVEEFEAASNEVDAMLASIQVRAPTYTDPTWGWSIAWDHAELRPSAIPDPDPETIIYLTEYAAAYEDDGLDIDIWMAHFAVPEDEGPVFLDPRVLLSEMMDALQTGNEDLVVEVPEGFEDLETSNSDRATGFFLMPSLSSAFGLPDYRGMVDIRVIVPGRAVLVTMFLWDDPHSEHVFPIFDEFLDNISIP